MEITPSGPAQRTLTVVGAHEPGFEQILTPAALAFVAALVDSFRGEIEAALARRVEVQARYDAGELPHFLPETKAVRDSDWTVAPLPADLQDRRVEITGPVERKMVINALNSGASTFMADFEDSNSPTWSNNISGQLNLRDAVRRTITFYNAKKDKHYALHDEVATLLVRPRGLHLLERGLELDGRPVPGCLVDFGLYFFHNARELLARGSGPYFYLPKLQSHLEARIWNAVFVKAQDLLGVPQGSIKATVLVETLPAVFEMHEILHELQHHSSGLNCGRWDYIFSFIKTRREQADAVMPDRGQIGMTQPFMRAYAQLLIQTCHKREVHAMGGMAAQIPIKRDPELNERAIGKVRNDKLREVTDGHDGTWVAHPGLVKVAMDVFDEHMPTPNQIANKRLDVATTAADLLAVPTGTRSLAGVRENVNVGLLYLEAWLRGNGCVPLYDLMEDAATAEISRTQLWQWVRHGALLDDGTVVTRELVAQVLDEELAAIRAQLGDAAFEAGAFDTARTVFEQVATSETFTDFLTLPAYDLLSA